MTRGGVRPRSSPSSAFARRAIVGHAVVGCRLRDRRPALLASSASESAGCLTPQRRRSPGASRGSASTSSCPIASSCSLRGVDRALDVRLVGVREPVGLGARRGDDRVLVEAERRLARARDREQVGDRLPGLRVGGRVRAALDHLERDAFARGDARRGSSAPSRAGRAELEVRRPRARERAGAEQRAAEVGAAAARAADDALRRTLERRAARPRARPPRAAPRAAPASTSTWSW